MMNYTSRRDGKYSRGNRVNHTQWHRKVTGGHTQHGEHGTGLGTVDHCVVHLKLV